MTIRQQGGVFGRHPSFSSVTADQIAISGSGSFGGSVSVNGNVVLASGSGVDFSATSGTGTSELFDDYEEGTWTATVGCTGNATTTTTVTGYYTKIGRQVTATFRELNNIDTTGLSGFLLVSLPFQVISVSTAFAGACAWESLTYPSAAQREITATASNGGTAILFVLSGDGISLSNLAATALTSGTTDLKLCTITYFTA